MLEFFRRHQRYFFLFITVIIVISFSFFGTYDAVAPEKNSHADVVAFKAIDGTAVTRQELDEMILFISSDSRDKLLFGGGWGPNFLNDGVVRKSLLDSGLAAPLISAYKNLLSEELQVKLQKEKRFVPYVHPQAKFLSSVNAWSYFVPTLKQHFDLLRGSEDPLEEQAVEARIALYLDGEKLPPQLLRQLLQYQEKQYNWISHDPLLDNQDMAIFGYYTLQDWFGSRFMQLAAEFIINSAKIAEKRGYVVTKEEALAALWSNAENSFKENLQSPYLGVADVTAYFNEQLRRMGLNKNSAVKIWQQVLLSNRLFDDMGSSVFIDPLFVKELLAYSHEKIEGDSYHLPAPLRLSNFQALQQFETYLDLISKRSSEEKAALNLPKQFLPIEEIKKKSPELLQKRYLLEIAKIDKRNLQAKVSVKETWAWEVADENWKILQNKFPEIGIKTGEDRASRFALLDSMDEVTRERIDNFSRGKIVESHPDWIDQALTSADPAQQLISLRLVGGKPPLPGIENREEFMAVLDAAPAAGGEEEEKKWVNYSENNSYYRLAVLDRSKEWEVVTFAEAKNDDSIDRLLDANLESFYTKTREAKEKNYRKEDGSWRPFKEVKEQIAEEYFSKILKSIKESYLLQHEHKDKELSPDKAAAWRLYPYVRAVYEQFKEDKNGTEFAPQEKEATEAKEPFSFRKPLEKQWVLVKELLEAERGSVGEKETIPEEAFNLPQDSWSKIYTPSNGDLFFFYLDGKTTAVKAAETVEKTMAAQKLLGDEAKQSLLAELVAIMKEHSEVINDK